MVAPSRPTEAAMLGNATTGQQLTYALASFQA
jgi:hypothetical protein